MPTDTTLAVILPPCGNCMLPHLSATIQTSTSQQGSPHVYKPALLLIEEGIVLESSSSLFPFSFGTVGEVLQVFGKPVIVVAISHIHIIELSFIRVPPALNPALLSTANAIWDDVSLHKVNNEWHVDVVLPKLK